MRRLLVGTLVVLVLWPSSARVDARSTAQAPSPSRAVLKIDEGYVDAHGVLIYYKAFGTGRPLLIVHGGPGATHDYFLPHLIPLARTHRLVFIDERGSGRSQQLEDTTGYTVERMVDDIEDVRVALGLQTMSLLGHSFGGVLAQAYAFKYPQRLDRLVLASTFHSTSKMNAVFTRMKANMAPALRERIDRMEASGVFGHGQAYEGNRYTTEYMTAAWGEGYFPYLYRRRPDPNYDPAASGAMAWDVYRAMWGSHGEFVIDGNLASVEYGDRLRTLKVPTLVIAGDHDQCDPALSREMHELIAGSKLVLLPESGHMTFVDQPALFLKAIDDFLVDRPGSR